MFPKNNTVKKFKLSKEDIEGIRKLGIISHSFDDNLDNKNEEKENLNNQNNEE